MKILIAYEIIPDGMELFILDLEGEELEKVKKAHGQYVNETERFDDALWLEEFLSTKTPLDHSEHAPFDITEVELLIAAGYYLN